MNTYYARQEFENPIPEGKIYRALILAQSARETPQEYPPVPLDVLRWVMVQYKVGSVTGELFDLSHTILLEFPHAIDIPRGVRPRQVNLSEVITGIFDSVRLGPFTHIPESPELLALFENSQPKGHSSL